MLHIYTDGACSQAGKSSGPGGWATIVMEEEKENRILSGGSEITTNNQMEMTAFLTALEVIAEEVLEDREGPFYIYSDSAYITNCFKQKWYQRWRINGWQTAKKENVKNKDLWIKMIELYEYFEVKGHEVKIIKVKGHSNNEGNNLADMIAVKERLKYE